MREISYEVITDIVAELCIKANKELSCDLVKRIEDCGKCETGPLAKSVMKDIKDNQCEKIFCLGDYVMAGPEPVETLNWFFDKSFD